MKLKTCIERMKKRAAEYHLGSQKIGNVLVYLEPISRTLEETDKVAEVANMVGAVNASCQFGQRSRPAGD